MKKVGLIVWKIWYFQLKTIKIKFLRVSRCHLFTMPYPSQHVNVLKTEKIKYHANKLIISMQ